MNLIQQFLIGVRFIGLKATLQTLQYTRYRDRVNKRFGVPSEQPKAAPIVPKKIEGVNPFHNGASFSFNDGIKLEVAFMSTHTVRVTWQPGRLPPQYAVSGEETIALRVERAEQTEGWLFTAGSLNVLVRWDGRIDYISNGVVVRQDAPPTYSAPAWQHDAALLPDSPIYGMGERTRWNLRPGEYRLWNQDIGGSYGLDADPLYITIPLYYCQQEIGGYMVFYENPHDGSAHFDDRAVFQFVNGALRLYFIEGPPAQTVEEFTRITGRPLMPPRWSLGFHNCRWGYESAEEVKKVVAGFKEHKLPLDAFHLDIDYMDGYRVFTNDPQTYPDLEALATELAMDGVKLVVILDPGVKIDPDYGVCQTGLETDAFLKLPNGERMRGLVWPGWVYFPDFTSSVVRRWWGEYYKRLMKDGVAGFWHDMNEPAVFKASGEGTLPRAIEHNLEGRGGTHEEAHNIYGLQMCAAGHQAVRNFDREKRPWFLTRSGWAGVQRYAWKWTGDVESTWPALKMTIATVLGLGMSGISYTGSDIGGFSGNPDGELYTRWFQMSTFMAFFRNHAAKGTKRREPWVFGEPYTFIIREMLALRKQFKPYLYNLAYEANQTGAPFVRPLFWLSPQDKRLWQIDDAYLLGDRLLVAPVVEQGAVTRSIFLPEGGWYNFWDDQFYTGGETVQVDAPLERIPLFVRAGSILPLMEDRCLTLHIYLPQDSAFDLLSPLYEDKGDGFGPNRKDTISLTRENEIVKLNWQTEGDYPLPDDIALVMHGAQPKRFALEDIHYDWQTRSIKIKPFENLRIELE
ncbi:MAG TPA: TIM-barrel domain-containing protein [Anaerolineales bacterium]|nr:TIM-barrel domain-containing protein [Anaerolineales bacterium]